MAREKPDALWMGVVADDITGSNDIGVMFAKAGLRVHVYSFPGEPGSLPAGAAAQEPPDILILDTNSRLDSPQSAYEKVFAATRRLQAAGCPRFFKKTCSVFRGNIGAEFDAMLDALGLNFAVVVLGFPKNGRITREGLHYVHGKLLEQSEFRNDPIHPMCSSNLVDILQGQTARRVRSLDYRLISRGPQALEEQLDTLRPEGGYLILDVTCQEDLRTVALAAAKEPALCGSSALAEELPYAWEAAGSTGAPAGLPPRGDLGVLCVAGSLMPQTAGQLEHLREQGCPLVWLDSLRLFEPEEREAEIERLAQEMASMLLAGQDAALAAPNTVEAVARTQAAGARRGFDRTATARQVSAALAETAARLVARCGLKRLVAAGGETSAAVCARLGVTGLQVWKEIQPGLPSCLSLTSEPMLLVLKSGSFGSRSFLEEAIQHLRSEGSTEKLL